MSASTFLSIFRSYTRLRSTNKIIRQCSTMRTTVRGDITIQLTEKTLLGRMMIYLNNGFDKHNTDILTTTHNNITINDLVHGKTNGLRKLNHDQVTNLFYAVNTNVLSYSKRNLQKVLKILDVECCLRLNSMDARHMFKILNAFMHVVPNRITEYKFYEYALHNIDACIEAASKKDLLQFIFYVGLQKNNKKAQIVLRKCLKNIIKKETLNDLTVEDLCIICNSTYRTNTKITNVQFLDKIKQTLNDNLSLLKDPALLITLLKTIKANKCTDDDLLSTISCTVFFNRTAQFYTFTAMCHILSLYSDYCYYDEELLDLFVGQCLDKLRDCKDVTTTDVYLTEQLRAKDIAQFLWSLAVLGYTKLDVKVLEDVIVPRIKERISIGEYKGNAEHLFRSVLSLWILNCRNQGLLCLTLTPEHLNALNEVHAKNKQLLNLLLCLIEMEDKSLFESITVQPLVVPRYIPDIQLKNRPLLQRIFEVLNDSTDTDVKKFELNIQIPYLNIMGISGINEKQNKTVNVEVLDDFTCVKNKDGQPSGFMRLKLRLLEQSDVPLITICQKDADELNDWELQNFLEDEIKMLC